MKTTHRFGLGLAATLGISALFLGFAGATPAHADDWDHYGSSHIYRDIADVRRDERLLRDLQARRDEARRHHDWDRVHFLDRRITDLRRHIEHDRRDIREDINRRRDRDRYRESRYRDSDDRYRTDRSRYRDSDRYDR